MSTALIKRELLDSLKDKEFRDAFKLENVYTGVCFQIRAIREQQQLSQKQMGRLAHMAQERISILEDPNAETKPTLSTLLRIADALDVGLDVRFVPFSKVIDRSVHTDMRELEVPTFEEEVAELEQRLNFDVKTDNAFRQASSGGDDSIDVRNGLAADLKKHPQGIEQMKNDGEGMGAMKAVGAGGLR